MTAVTTGFFTQNTGQIANEEVRFYTAAGGMEIGFARSTVLFSVLESARAAPDAGWQPGGIWALIPITRSSRPGVLVRLTFEGANPVEPTGLEELPHRSNFIIGNDAARWRTAVRSFREIVFSNLYDGIDLLYRQTDQGVKYEFRLAPGTSPGRIRGLYEGVEALEPFQLGLVVRTPIADIRDGAPLAVRADGSVFPCRFVILDPRSFSFDCDSKDASQSLIIDPLIYATFVGGSSWDSAGSGLAVDSSGNAVIAGSTWSLDFPATPGAFNTRLRGVGDAYVAKFSPTGALLFATYLGGTAEIWEDTATDLAVTASGDIYVTGTTNATDFPVTAGAFDTTFNATGSCVNACLHAFVARLSPDGSTLTWATYLGGRGQELSPSIALDSSGNAYISGSTTSPDFPVTVGAFDTTHGVGTDGFVTKLRADGAALLWSTFLGDAQPGRNGSDSASDVAVDGLANVVVAGVTGSPSFPVTPGALDTVLNGSTDAFVTKLRSDGAALLWSTFLGGKRVESSVFLALDSAGNVYLTGDTNSTDFPATPGAFDIWCGKNGNCDDRPGYSPNDAFVTELRSDGAALLWSTFLGGENLEYGRSIQVDATGTVYVVGETNSTDFPVTPGAFEASLSGGWDAFIVRLNAVGTSLIYSSFLGGTASDRGLGVAIDGRDILYLSGLTLSADFPLAPAGFDRTYGGGGDAFLVKIAAAAPDLAESKADIGFAPASPVTVGTHVVISANVHNVGTWNASDVKVRIYDGPPPSSNRIGSDQFLALVPAFGGTGTVSLSWIADPPGIHTICIVVDPDNSIVESNESNNAACNPLFVLGLPDYVPFNPRPLSPVVTGVSVPVILSVEVRNGGGSMPSTPVLLTFFNGTSPLFPFSQTSVLPIPANGAAGPFTATWTAPTLPGSFDVTALVDAGGDLAEANETNNAYVWRIDVVEAPLTSLHLGAPNFTADKRYVTTSTEVGFTVIDRSGTGVRTTQYQIDGGPWLNFTATGMFTLRGEGEHLLEWYSEDFAGNVESGRSARIVVDDTPPVTSIALGTPRYQGRDLFVTSATLISLTSTDAGTLQVGTAFAEYRTDGGPWRPYASPFTVAGVDGSRRLEYRSGDLLGNLESTRVAVVVLDDTPPSTTSAPEMDAFTPETPFSLSATDAGSGVARIEVRIDGGAWADYDGPFTLSLGAHSVQFRSTDRLGNIEPARVRDVLVSAPPTPVNVKSLVALIFCILLTALGVWSSRRAPRKGRNGKATPLGTFCLFALPFVVAEAGTGLVSIATGSLSIPPLLGTGSIVDSAILMVGLGVAVSRGLHGKMNAERHAG